MAEENRKIERVNGGEVKEFSAIHGKKDGAEGPKAKNYGEKKAIVGILDKKNKCE